MVASSRSNRINVSRSERRDFKMFEGKFTLRERFFRAWKLVIEIFEKTALGNEKSQAH